MSLLINFFIICSLSSLLKLLLVPSYRSTDFEVHRNWLALTHSLPYEKWYFDNTSQWTLDYPPFFAWYEYGLAKVAHFFDEKMLDVKTVNYFSEYTLYFQRLSVIFADFLLFYSSYRCCSSMCSSKDARSSRNMHIYFIILVTCNAGLYIVDHIHFQYNGFLFGMLFLSLANVMDGGYLWGAFWFATLLNFKHIFLYMAPAYGIFLLRSYCMDPKKKGFQTFLSLSILRLIILGSIVIGVFAISFGPFLNNINQVLSRLFPFKRGLTHAYWAPNFWALYNVADKTFAILGDRFKMVDLSQNNSASFSKGLVEETQHLILPLVSPFLTVVLTLVSILPCLLDLFFYPRGLSRKHLTTQFLRSLVFISLSSFMFGWHVHEKAILMAILPLTLLAIRGTRKDAEIFVLLQAVGHYSLFPLLFKPFETVIKICLVLLYSIFSFYALHELKASHVGKTSSWCFPLLNLPESLYVVGLGLCEIYCSIIHRFMLFNNRLQFLPLLLTSCYCACGVTWCWIKLYYNLLMDRSGYPIEWNANFVKAKDHQSPVAEKRYLVKKKDHKKKAVKVD